MRHDVFGHMAMERSKDFQKALDMVGKLHDMGGKKIVALWQEVFRHYPDVPAEVFKKEVLATMAERGIKNAIVDRAITGVMSILRKMGIDAKATDAELNLGRRSREPPHAH